MWVRGLELASNECVYTVWSVCIQSVTLISGVTGKNSNWTLVAPPWGWFKRNAVAYLPQPSWNVRAKFHANCMVCSWFGPFCSNGVIVQTSKANLSLSGWNMGNLHYPSQSHGCKDTVYQIACILDKLRRNRVNNFFCRTWPHGGATTGLSEKCGAEVRSWPLMSVCTKFRTKRTNGAGD